MVVAGMLKGRKVHPELSVAIAPGSRQVLEMITANGALQTMISAGCRIMEAACGFCVGAGQVPPSGGVSVRTSNRNYKGRSGTADANVYLTSPETAVVIGGPRRGCQVSRNNPLGDMWKGRCRSAFIGGCYDERAGGSRKTLINARFALN